MTAVPPVRNPRVLGVACAALALAAVLLWVASAVVWEAGAVRTGAQVAPSLTGVALFALAGVAGVLCLCRAVTYRRPVGLSTGTR